MKYALFFALAICVYTSFSQPFQLRINEVNNSFSPAIHSGAFVVHDDKWVMVGGRKNGLHGFHPPFAFPTSGVNDSIFVCDVAANQRWSASVENLPDSIREAITSSNMEFFSDGGMLYMIGGYGWKEELQNFITWPTLTAIDLNGLTAAVMQQQSIVPYFRQYTDTNLAVCGAHLQKMDSTYLLVFGHRFDGYYNRLNNTGFNRQTYTNEIRKFKINDDGQHLSIYDYTVVTDTNNFHRRDYNLVPGIDTWTGKKILTAYSGVFRKDIDLPYLDCIEISDTSYRVVNAFNQNLSQYHSAFAMLYDTSSYTQHTLFFGGMSMFYYDTLTNNLVQDSFVPFVQTISDVVRNLDGDYFEFNTGVWFPALLGTNAYFFLDKDVPVYKNEFVHLNRITGTQRIGYVIGGIESPELNVGLSDASQSFASARMFEVLLVKDSLTVGGMFSATNNDVTNATLFPNPANGKTILLLDANTNSFAEIWISSADGRKLKSVYKGKLSSGKQSWQIDVSDLPATSYQCSIKTERGIKTLRLMKQ